MKVKFKVVDGPGARREFRIPLPKCLIGRNQDCHLRLKSEAISRHHCVVYVRGGKLLVQDLRSRNGTHVNDRLVQGECELGNGDELRLGPLVVKIQIDHERNASLTPTVNGASAIAVGYQAKAPCPLDDSSIAEWVEQADAIAQARRLNDPDTRRFEPRATDQPKVQPGSHAPSDANDQETTEGQEHATASSALERPVPKLRDQTTGPGKLPVPVATPSKDSSEAAENALKRFFGRR